MFGLSNHGCAGGVKEIKVRMIKKDINSRRVGGGSDGELWRNVSYAGSIRCGGSNARDDN